MASLLLPLLLLFFALLLIRGIFGRVHAMLELRNQFAHLEHDLFLCLHLIAGCSSKRIANYFNRHDDE